MSEEFEGISFTAYKLMGVKLLHRLEYVVREVMLILFP